MSNLDQIDHIGIQLASPEKVLEWSFGEVKKPETINYKTYKPEKDGLFCEKIFGPVKDYECASWCGKYKKAKFKGKICENCGVEVTTSKVRRERMGHIKLAAPVAHFWFFKSQTYMSALLDIPPKKLESIIYCHSHIVIDPGDTHLAKLQLLSGNEYAEALSQYGNHFRAGIGGEAIRELLAQIHLDDLAQSLQQEIQEKKGAQREKLIKRLSVVDSFRRSNNRPEWMIIENLPVIPPDLRPMVQLDGGRFATADLNDFYRRIINRNNRLKKLLKLNGPDIIIENEKKMLQEAVDALIANHRKQHPVMAQGKRELKSLSSSLENKQGRFRQNLLGKRVDYSGRSVITVGPDLKLHQCGIPRVMALELFKPFIMHELVEQGYANTIQQAKKKIEQKKDEVLDVLEQVVARHPVLLNRAPTLHKLSIRAFEPVIIEGKAISLHPLVCSAYNADFDGDTMSVHIPLSHEAQAEARVLLLASRNLLHPQNGKSAVTPSQDMVLGCYYLTIETEGDNGEGKFFASEEEAIRSYEKNQLSLHAKIIVYVGEHHKFNGAKYLVTTVGKLLLNRAMPAKMMYVNDPKLHHNHREDVFTNIEQAAAYLKNRKSQAFTKSFLEDLISFMYDELSMEETAQMLDGLKDVGFHYAMRAGITISLADIYTPQEKPDLLMQTEETVKEIEKLYAYGRITDQERYEHIVSAWGETSEKVADLSMRLLDARPLNPISMMIVSGARGSRGQYRQLAAMRGLMADPSGKTIERPIKANFKEGLSVFEYFTSTHGARKGMSDTSLKTADAGYLTRRMVDVAQDIVVTQHDCGSEEWTWIEAIKPQIDLKERIVGRVLAQDLHVEGDVRWLRNTVITESMAQEITKHFEKVPIRTLLTCQSERGVCALCYGIDLSTRFPVEIGEAVGVIAAQSIGEPGTQLTMRTFHSGGVAGDDITQGLPRIEEIFEARKTPKGQSVLSRVRGRAEVVNKGRVKEVHVQTEDDQVEVYAIPFGQNLLIENGSWVDVGQPLTQGSMNPHHLTELKGIQETQKYLIEEVQKVYRRQGVKINDKHIEIIIRQMSRKVVVKDPGGSKLIYNRKVDRHKLRELNRKLEKEGKKPVITNDILLGITEASLSTDSFLSAASFQETHKALTEAAIKGKKDYLRGLKESVITGKKIPAGTGFYREEEVDC